MHNHVPLQDQYVFIHDALLEYIQSGDTEVSSSEIGQFVETLKRNNAAQGDTLLQRLYKVTHMCRHARMFQL